jgi:hypothetical protein
MGLLGPTSLPEEEGVQADQAGGVAQHGVCAQMTGLVDQQKRMCDEWPETVE